MAIYDISLPLHDAHPPWPGDPPFSRTPLAQTTQGDPCNTSELRLSTHFATHLDAPYHFIPDGPRMDQINLDPLLGPALLHETDAAPLIEPHHLPPLEGVERILFKTANTKRIADTVFHTDYIALSPETARCLTQAGVKLIGIHYFSVEPYQSADFAVHHELCGKGVIILEGIDVREVPPGWYELIALPLRIQAGDGSPCRALLRDQS